MKLLSRIFPTALLLFIVSLSVSAQTSTYQSNQRTPGYWTFGINGGLAYQQSDLPVTLDGGWGAGLTLAKNLYYRPGGSLAFDLRGRALYSESYGFGTERAYNINDNEMLNGQFNLDYTKAAGESGFVFHNNKTHLGELGLEGVVHFNKLRERTNWDLSLFGGVGVGWYKARMDQSKNGSLYTQEYLGIDTTASASTIRRQLRNGILDGTYETDGQGMNDWGNLSIMPGAGIELGYQLTPKFSIGLGHKVTFTNSDIFDGVKYENNGDLSADNDWHHYTNLNLRWIIDPAQKRQPGPKIEMVNPHTATQTVYSSKGFVRARIKNVQSAMEVDLIVNGTSTPFDFDNGIMKSHFELQEGTNRVTVSAYNANGNDTEEVIIIYKDRSNIQTDDLVKGDPVIDDSNDEPVFDEPVDDTPPVYEAMPVVKITRPYRNTETVNNDRYTVRATIENVDYRDDVYFSVNGRTQNNFSFRNERFEADIYLKEGSNRIEIEGRNSRGKRSDRATLILEIEERTQKPMVKITRPYNDPYTTENSTERIEATVRPIGDGCSVIMKVNGRSVNGWDLNGDRFRGDVRLREGKNEVEIVAVNDAGKGSDKVIIYYEEEKPYEPLTVKITKPYTDPYTTEKSRERIEATIRPIDNGCNVIMKVNGRPVNGWDLDGDRFRGDANLELGRNEVEIVAVNGSQQRSDKVIIFYEKPYQKVLPKVDITTPNRNNTRTENQRVTIKANIDNVERKSDIRFLINGRSSTDFTFLSSKGKFTGYADLRTGNNTIKIEATNRDGRDDDQVKIEYFVQKTPPTVDIRKPSNGSTVKRADVDFEGRVKHVDSKSDIELRLNGKRVYNFDFRGEKVTARLTLKEGRNDIILKATNDDGRDEDQIKVTYRKPVVVVKKPTVDFITPNKKVTSKTPSYNISVRVRNVKSKNEITVKSNGKSIRFDFDSRKGIVNAAVRLSDGNNKVVVTASNKGGRDSDSETIVYKGKTNIDRGGIGQVNIAKPEINNFSLSQPATDPLRPNSAKTRVSAQLKNVKSKSEITLIFNGQRVKRFDFDATTGFLSAIMDINRGKHYAKITVKTKGGTVNKSASVTF